MGAEMSVFGSTSLGGEGWWWSWDFEMAVRSLLFAVAALLLLSLAGDVQVGLVGVFLKL